MHLQNFKISFETPQNEEKLELSSATSLGQQSRHCISVQEEGKTLLFGFIKRQKQFTCLKREN